MSPVKKIILVAFSLSTVFITIALLFADEMDQILDIQNMAAWLRSYPLLGWLGAILLISADLITPMPAPAIVTALGIVYGGTLGSFFGATGLLSVGLLGYGLARFGGGRWAFRIASESEMAGIRDWFNRWGFIAIALTRMLPMIPEILSVLAGLAHMSFPRYALALAAGSIPVAIMFAFLGDVLTQNPFLAFGISFLLPLALLFVFHFTKIADISGGDISLQDKPEDLALS